MAYLGPPLCRLGLFGLFCMAVRGSCRLPR